MKLRTRKVEMIRDANCTRFLVPIKFLQLVIITMKQSKFEKIHINGDQIMILKQNKRKPNKPALLQMEKSKVLMGGLFFYFN